MAPAQTRRRWVRWMGVTLASVVLLPIGFVNLDGLAMHWLLPTRPTFELYQQDGRTTPRLFVYFTGVQASGVAHSAALRPTWLRRGDVLVVEYPLTRHDHTQIVAGTIEWLRDHPEYSTVTLIGSSMGVNLSADLLLTARAEGLDRQFQVIAHDGPNGAASLTNAANPAVEVLYPGAVTSPLITRAFWKYAFHPPGPSGWGAGADPAIMAADWAVSGSYPLSAWTADIRYLRRHPAPAPGSLRGVPVVVIRSVRDTDVRDTTAAWLAAFGAGPDRLLTVDAPHVSLTTHPAANREVYEQAIDLLAA